MLSLRNKFVGVSCLMILFTISSVTYGASSGEVRGAKKFSLRPGQRARVTISSPGKPISAHIDRGYYKTGSWNFAGSTVWKSGRNTFHRCDVAAPNKSPNYHYTMGKHPAKNWQYQVTVNTRQPKGGYATKYKITVKKY
jgi:hypothetical protein